MSRKNIPTRNRQGWVAAQLGVLESQLRVTIEDKHREQFNKVERRLYLELLNHQNFVRYQANLVDHIFKWALKGKFGMELKDKFIEAYSNDLEPINEIKSLEQQLMAFHEPREIETSLENPVVPKKPNIFESVEIQNESTFVSKDMICRKCKTHEHVKYKSKQTSANDESMKASYECTQCQFIWNV